MAFRGGRRGGGGRGGSAINPRLMGIDVEPDFSPSAMYPTMAVPIQTPANAAEYEMVRQFLHIRREIRNGPLFTGSNVSKSSQSLNDGIKRYTDKYIKKRKVGRSIDEHSYAYELFPSELHGVMGLKSGKKKTLDLSNYEPSNMDPEDQVVNRLKKIDEQNETNGGENGAEEDVDNENESEMEEDSFDEDDDDDYNAEKYFDDGDDFGIGDDEDNEAAY